MAKRRKTTKGRIFTRGKQARWYVQYYTREAGSDGLKQVVKRLLNSEGEPCKNRTEAEAAAALLTAPAAMTDKAAQLRAAVATYETVEAKAAALIEAARPKLAIADMWEKHPYTVNTRGSRERELSPGTIKDNLSQWKHFTEWAAGEKIEFAEDVTADHAKAFRASLGLSSSRQNQIAGLCKVMFRQAGIEPNPFDDLRQLAHTPKGRRELTTEELHTVCTSAVGELRTLFAIGIYTGLRLGDAARLEWNEIAPDFATIKRLPGKTSYKGQELTIPLHPVLSAILQETPPAARVGFVLPETGPKYGTNKAEVSRAIQAHLTACGIQTHRRGTGQGTNRRASVEVGFHSLRHSFVSICARQGVPLHVVQALCGHSTPAVQKLYLHHSTEDTTKAINSLPAIGEKAATDPEASERAQMKRLADVLPIETVRRLLAITKSAKPGEKPAENGQ